MWWKFGLKAVYMLVSLLGSHCEFKTPKTLMIDFGIKCLHKLISVYYPEIVDNPEKVL